ncbi:ABC transporter ATP-binding protein [Cellulosimicrobium cellulans]|uniref:ABC transporter ATP-binding protein n=1 Tax=Cellulosimicrobium cellulans TaxID=1710 RepID=UPI00130DB844|nr:ABC transporter ATP-binding protein [Cellulosimicrobium cellulans]
MPLVEVRHLSVDYRSRDLPPAHAVRDVSFDLAEGEFVGLLGESGCGKSTLGNALLRLLDRPAHHAGGEVRFDGRDLYALTDRELNRLRWREIATVFQSSMNALNPVLRVERQFRDTMEAHRWDPRTEGDPRERVLEVLRDVDLDAERVLRSYPHELSGGMRQRVVLALALLLRPRLVVLDEPTTGLDVVVQRSIVDLLRRLQREHGFSVLFISHDLGTVLEIADRVLVMYAGQIVESRPSAELAADPLHPYTRGLLGSFADPRDERVSVTAVPGRPPSLDSPPAGCAFAPRCPVRVAACAAVPPVLAPPGAGDAGDGTAVAGAGRVGGRAHAGTASPDDADGLVRCHRHTPEGADEPTVPDAAPPFPEVMAWASGPAGSAGAATAPSPLLVADGLVKTYTRRRGLRREEVRAVRGVSFALAPGRVQALVGQSGSGKSTVAKMLTGTERPTAGTVTLEGRDVTRLRGAELRSYRSQVQMVFQDPFAALNPTKSVGASVGRPLRNHLGLSGDALRERVVALLDGVGLSPGSLYVDKLPHQLSGGQRQRVVIARAMAPRPRLLIADEPISMLDVSIRAEILELLATTVQEQDVAMLYITHDLLSARLLADDLMVMRDGAVVEQGPTVQVVREPEHAYTETLLAAVPRPPGVVAR